VVSGHVDVDALALPAAGDPDVPLPFGMLHGWRGDVRLGVGRLIEPGGLAMRDASARLVLANDRLSVEQFAATLGSGRLRGAAAIDAGAKPPQFRLQARLSDAAITGPVFDSSIDLLAGRADITVNVTASGYSPSVMLATLEGHAALSVHDGLVAGFDLFRLKHAIEDADPTSVQANAEAALQSGTTGFAQLEIAGEFAHGNLTIDTGAMTGTAGAARVEGSLDLANHAIDVWVRPQLALPDPPDLAIHLNGAFDKTHRVVELADLARWMAALAH
jgi:uncharacterized protein involved in outer membrane biogenesis